MWVVGILTSIAAMWVFFRQGLYASFGLNTYYLVTSIIGLWQWRRDIDRVSREGASVDNSIRLKRLSFRTIAISAFIVVSGTSALALLMSHLENPMSYLDSAVAVLSAVATWWLVRCYIQQWWLWVAADTVSTILCAAQGLWWMAALYAAYAVSAIIGYIHWKKHGRYIE
jgi:nicotinamide mononucleotide transporter